MLFNSIEFAFFFPVVTLLFFLLPHRFRWALLLFASCFFYMFFKPVYILILVFTIIIDYFAGLWISKEKNQRRKKFLLLMSICANVGVLVFFKYYNFIAENINIVLNAVHTGHSIPFLNILLPIGLSFHTFQAMAYTVEVYRGKQPAERHFGIYALYVMFYPQLVAGPIERPQNIIHQFYEKKQFKYENVKSGLILMGWGLFKKVVIADRLAMFVNQVYNDPFSYSGLQLITATVFFAFQIFCDFSGYSDIAIGSARCMGFDLMVNFDRPYRAVSVSEFWRRWHISLSTWFRDYVYIPLGGNRVSEGRWYFNLLVVFVLSGAWHGARWTFIIWGLLHGIYLIVEGEIKKKVSVSPAIDNRVKTAFSRLLVFTLVCVAWVFFRATSVKESMYVITHFFSGIPMQLRAIVRNVHMERLKYLYVYQPATEFFAAIGFILVLISVHALQKKLSFDSWLTNKPAYIRWPFYYALVLTFIYFGVFNRSEFIYFQF